MTEPSVDDFPIEDGGSVSFACPDDMVSRWVHRDILSGQTYPHLPFIDDVRVVFDVGANCGSSSLLFARRHPGAVVHAFEPGSEQLSYLERNATDRPSIRVHPFGFHAVDQTVPLYLGDGHTGYASIAKREVNLDLSEVVELRAAGPWAVAQGIERIDVLKLDVEGCEPIVLSSLRRFIPTMQVVYVEYDSRRARREIEQLLTDTHELYRGRAFLDQGELVYIHRDRADRACVAEVQPAPVEDSA